MWAEMIGSPISIHPPLAGWDKRQYNQIKTSYISIHPPLAGWDGGRLGRSRQPVYFNPPTPCGVGLHSIVYPRVRVVISIHPPLAGWDALSCRPARGRVPFQSTHPLRGGTYKTAQKWHADFYFNPPTPCGVGPPEIDYETVTIPDFNPPTPCGVGHRDDPERASCY